MNNKNYKGASKSLAEQITKLDIGELSDPVRRTEQIFSKDDIANTLIDLYLFGKGADINA